MSPITTCTPGPIRDCFLSNLHSTHADITPPPTHAHAHTHTHVRMYTPTHMYIRTHPHTRTHTHTHTHTLILPPPHTHTHAHTHTHTYPPTHTHTHTHTHSDNTFNGSSTLAVVAAELTLDSLRGFVRQALPLCEGSSQVSCFIIDDLGSIIYDEVVVHSGMYRGGALFLERPFQNNRLDAIRVLFTSLQGNLVTKRECEDYFVVGVETRRFYSVSDCPLVINTRTYCMSLYIYVLL